MDFLTTKFVTFLLIFVLLYFTVKKEKLLVLFGASLVFFMESTGLSKYLLIIFFSIILNFASAIIINNETDIIKKRAKTSVSIAITLIPIVIYKISSQSINGFSVQNALFGIIPIGLSFITFSQISYLFDVYNRKSEPERNFLLYSLYILYFPKILAGPIERAGNLFVQFRENHEFSIERINSGFKLIFWGAFKKVVVSGLLGLFVNPIYDNVHFFNGVDLTIATIFFAFQIYYDFSAYTDIAIGVSRLFGISLSPNFNMPYLSQSISEFWRRWHMTLSSWARDYIYIPLGGNRVGLLRTQINLSLVFLVIGLWHGFSLNFVAWGLLNGFYLIIFFSTKKLRKRMFCFFGDKILRTSSIIITFAMINASWIVFRSKSLSDSAYIFKNIFSGWTLNLTILLSHLQNTFGLIELGIAVTSIIITETIHYKMSKNKKMVLPTWIRWTAYLVALWLILGILITQGGIDNFIYQRF